MIGRRRRTRPTLLVRYGVTSLVLFLALGTVLGHLLQRSIEERVFSDTMRQAQLITRLGIQDALLPEELDRGMSPDRVTALHRILTVTLSPIDVVDVAIHGLDGRYIYHRDRSLLGELADTDGPLGEALAGHPVSVVRDVSDEPDLAIRRHGTVMEAYLPLQLGYGRGIPHEGVVRATLPYAPIQAAIDQNTRRLFAALALALAVLYAVLFRLVAGASRALRHQSAVNEHQALHDTLTELPNRSLFQDRLAHAVAVARRSDEAFAVVLLDLDRFKDVNDTLGHHHGDLLLQAVAARLAHTLRAGDTVARLGGDEFAFLLPGVGDEASADGVAGKVKAALERPFDVLGLPLEIDASMGVALFPRHGDRPDELLQRADVAMYEAKRNHLGHALYDVAQDRHSLDRLTLSTGLRRALEQDELVLYYQPKHDLRTGRVADVEALVRWRHPQRGLLGPDRFIPVAERTDLIGPLTADVLRKALRDCRRWRDEGLDVGVAVNLSVRNLLADDLLPVVARALAEHDVPPAVLTLELTETMLAADPARAGRAVQALHQLGVRLSIDDFGTGYSSLAVLRSTPVHELKIDRSFVRDLCTSVDASAIVGFSCDLGHQLGLQVVAEGVEDVQVADELRRLGCDVAQGYLFARPVPFEVLLPMLHVDGRYAAGHGAVDVGRATGRGPTAGPGGPAR